MKFLVPVLLAALIFSAACKTRQSDSSISSTPAQTKKVDSGQKDSDGISEAEQTALESEFDKKLEFNIGKCRRIRGLTNDLLIWYEKDPRHPEAVSESKELCRNLSEFATDEINLANWMGAHPTALRGSHPGIQELGDLIHQLKSAQLRGMGFSCDKISWK